MHSIDSNDGMKKIKPEMSNRWCRVDSTKGGGGVVVEVVQHKFVLKHLQFFCKNELKRKKNDRKCEKEGKTILNVSPQKDSKLKKYSRYTQWWDKAGNSKILTKSEHQRKITKNRNCPNFLGCLRVPRSSPDFFRNFPEISHFQCLGGGGGGHQILY